VFEWVICVFVVFAFIVYDVGGGIVEVLADFRVLEE
jgi:hypothetical protein